MNLGHANEKSSSYAPAERDAGEGEAEEEEEEEEEGEKGLIVVKDEQPSPPRSGPPLRPRPSPWREEEVQLA